MQLGSDTGDLFSFNIAPQDCIMEPALAFTKKGSLTYLELVAFAPFLAVIQVEFNARHDVVSCPVSRFFIIVNTA